MTDFAICTTTTTGLLIGYAKLSTPKKIGTGDTAKFATGDLKCKLDQFENIWGVGCSYQHGFSTPFTPQIIN